MEILQAKNFLNKLTNSNKKDHYLTVHGNHRYSVISGDNAKASKTLNTTQISDLVEGCFEALKGGDLSTENRAKIMKDLGTQIKNYKSRVYRSKKWYQKIGSWFGIISDGEKKLNRVAKQVKVEKKTNIAAKEEIQRIHSVFVNIQETNLASETQQQKKVYMRIFSGVGTEAVRNENLEGFTQSGGIKSFIDDLTTYNASLDESQVGLKSDIEKKIELLTKAYHISTMREFANNKRTSVEDKQVLLKELQLHVYEEIQELAENGAVGDQILIPGGYEKSSIGHAVLYQVVKTSENKCSFTIINAGDGAKESNSLKGNGASFLNAFSQTIFGSNVVRELVKDIKYNNVNFNDLDQPFLKSIFEQQFHLEEKDPMGVVKTRIDEALTKNSQVKKSEGREHSAQEIGSCTFKSVSSWLKDSFLSEKEYNKFKAAYTKWDMEKLESIHQSKTETVKTSKFSHPNNKAKELREKQETLQELDKMLTKGKDVLRKRQNKAQ